jgi:hypothetical protein
MWRVALWRLGLEWWNFVAWLMQIAPFVRFERWNRPVDYFAFGANLDPQVLTRRRMRVRSETEILLRDHALHFNQPGPLEGFGFASVEAAPGCLAYGKLLTLSRIDAIRMDYYEVLPHLRRHRRVWAEQDGRRFFFYQATYSQDGLLPTREYLDKILYSAERSAVIPDDLLSELRNTPTLIDLHPRGVPNFLLDDYGSGPPWLVDLRRRYDVRGTLLFIRLYGITLFSRWIRPQLPPEPINPLPAPLTALREHPEITA